MHRIFNVVPWFFAQLTTFPKQEFAACVCVHCTLIRLLITDFCSFSEFVGKAPLAFHAEEIRTGANFPPCALRCLWDVQSLGAWSASVLVGGHTQL
jgi:hypothetical protein